MIIVRNIHNGEMHLLLNHHDVKSFMWGRDIKDYQFAAIKEWQRFDSENIDEILAQCARAYNKLKGE